MTVAFLEPCVCSGDCAACALECVYPQLEEAVGKAKPKERERELHPLPWKLRTAHARKRRGRQRLELELEHQEWFVLPKRLQQPVQEGASTVELRLKWPVPEVVREHHELQTQGVLVAWQPVAVKEQPLVIQS